MSSCVLIQGGGSLSIDDNNRNVAANSVARGIHIFAISGGIPNCSAGTIIVIDPTIISYELEQHER
ncbi:MAG: hypothetical protein ACOYOA_00935 [Saprospiraceae bacterium]